MRTLDTRYGYDGVGAKEELIARVQDIKASPSPGKNRLVIREKDKNLSHAVIDIDMKASRDLRSKETYVFQVNEKDDSRNPGFQRKRSAEFKVFECDEKPMEYSSAYDTQKKFGRFGSNDRLKGSRTRF